MGNLAGARLTAGAGFASMGLLQLRLHRDVQDVQLGLRDLSGVQRHWQRRDLQPRPVRRRRSARALRPRSALRLHRHLRRRGPVSERPHDDLPRASHVHGLDLHGDRLLQRRRHVRSGLGELQPLRVRERRVPHDVRQRQLLRRGMVLRRHLVHEPALERRRVLQRPAVRERPLRRRRVLRRRQLPELRVLRRRRLRGELRARARGDDGPARPLRRDAGGDVRDERRLQRGRRLRLLRRDDHLRGRVLPRRREPGRGIDLQRKRKLRVGHDDELLAVRVRGRRLQSRALRGQRRLRSRPQVQRRDWHLQLSSFARAPSHRSHRPLTHRAGA
jgi:hypothetical protein